MCNKNKSDRVQTSYAFWWSEMIDFLKMHLCSSYCNAETHLKTSMKYGCQMPSDDNQPDLTSTVKFLCIASEV